MGNLVIVFFAFLVHRFWSWISILIGLTLAYFLMRGFITEVCGEVVKLFR